MLGHTPAAQKIDPGLGVVGIEPRIGLNLLQQAHDLLNGVGIERLAGDLARGIDEQIAQQQIAARTHAAQPPGQIEGEAHAIEELGRQLPLAIDLQVGIDQPQRCGLHTNC